MKVLISNKDKKQKKSKLNIFILVW
jgi:hypothetical protein